MTPDTPQQILPQTPAAPAPPPVFASSSPTGSKPKVKSTTPTFLGAAASPTQSNQGFKTLTGQ